MKTIRVASYNIRKAIGTDRRRVPERVLDVLGEIDADIIALQEADRRFGVRSAAIPPLLLDNLSCYKSVPINVQADSMGWHGNAILVRKDAQIGAHEGVLRNKRADQHAPQQGVVEHQHKPDCARQAR